MKLIGQDAPDTACLEQTGSTSRIPNPVLNLVARKNYFKKKSDKSRVYP